MAEQLAEIEALATRLGMSRIGLIAIAGAPSHAARIAADFAAKAVTVEEVRSMIAEARLTPSTGSSPQSRVPPSTAENG